MEDIGGKLQGDDSYMEEKHRPLPAEEKGSLRGRQTSQECTERHVYDGGCQGSQGCGPQTIPSYNDVGKKRTWASHFFFDKILLYQYSF